MLLYSEIIHKDTFECQAQTFVVRPSSVEHSLMLSRGEAEVTRQPHGGVRGPEVSVYSV